MDYTSPDHAISRDTLWEGKIQMREAGPTIFECKAELINYSNEVLWSKLLKLN